ncbi:hypothetical protein CVIRNUC_004940 [Coccomyxa viridis]|uniref:Fluoride ion transporter CrcB n=1 Tax=Coccomyxa viridis TaxID=1274662 RepID=A0AAV1I4V2_9CHLO|nr:hypothetical protein CVIRNUC_004940 [Coccomyxa viridis]
MKPERARELTVVLIHLAFWSQLGVLTRIYLDRFFSDGCRGTWGLCLTSDGTHHRSLGAYFTDLPPNILGSFIMGLFAASGSLGLPQKKELAILPESSSWQAAPELHIGLRTGYCGSLTTFASWEYSLVTSLIGGLGKQGGQWAEFLWGLIIGLQLSLASYVFGQHCALCIDYYLVPGGAAEADLEFRSQEQIHDVEEVRRGRLSEEERALERDYDVDGTASADDREGDDRWLTQQSPSQDMQDRDTAHENGRTAPQSLNVQSSRPEKSKEEKSTDKPQRLGTVLWLGDFLWQADGKFPFHRKTNLAVIAMTGLMTALFIALTVLDREPQHQARRGQWLAVLLGPFGCTTRWLLSKTNYKLRGRWNWLPVGTFAANMLGCLVDYILGGVNARVGNEGYWGSIVTYAIRTGCSGALSTVSTFVAEVHGQLKMVPEKLRGYTYSVGSLLAGALLGVIVYGSMVWAS